MNMSWTSYCVFMLILGIWGGNLLIIGLSLLALALTGLYRLSVQWHTRTRL